MFKRSAKPSSGGSASLHDRVRASLAQGFKGSLPDYSLGSSEADLLIHQGPRVAVFEVKTGDPELPLPSSTSTQMLLLKQRVRQNSPARMCRKFSPCWSQIIRSALRTRGNSRTRELRSSVSIHRRLRVTSPGSSH